MTFRLQSLVWFVCLLLGGLGMRAPRVQADEEKAREFLAQAQIFVAEGDSLKATAAATQAIAEKPDFMAAFYLRGREQFRLARIQESIADFDRQIALDPNSEPRHWERGIAYYYAGEFEKGAKQFELYQTYHDNDVENSVWRYLCMARELGVKKARETMLPIKNDRRVPMMQVFEMFRGTLQPAEVLQAAEADSPTEEVLAARLFYAHLYLGLFYEANGNEPQAQKYIFLAADKRNAERRVNRYMWDVARIHADLIRQQGKDSVSEK